MREAGRETGSRRAPRGKSLQLEDLPRFQERAFRWQRLGWLGMAFFVIAGSAGLFGQGFLSRAAAVDETGGMRLDYERFARVSVPSVLTVRTIQQVAGDPGPLRLRISRSYTDEVLIRSVLPAPTQISGDSRDLILSFSPPAAGEAVIRFQVEPLQAGWLDLDLQMDRANGVRARQFVYP